MNGHESGSIYGSGQATQPARAEMVHETRARNWTAAKNRLEEAQAFFVKAKAEEEAARVAEESAWLDLHESSGRIPPREGPAEDLAGPFRPFPPPGGFIPTTGLR